MRRAAVVQRVAGWIIVAVGAVHLGVTFVDYDALSLRALWFVGSGFALLLIGGLNVIAARLPVANQATFRELRLLTLGSDVCGLVLGGMFVVLTSGTEPQGPLLVTLFLVAAIAQLVSTRQRA